MNGKPGCPKGAPKTGGRQKGTPNKATAEAREVCSKIINDPVYRANLVRRANEGTLSPAMEALIWHYSYGKPKEMVAHSGEVKGGGRIAIYLLRSGRETEAEE
ncbi:MAG: hypothetical protein LC804_09880 [Acidobacteria bacterium]|nr:hypothetical protein [Acidobacteriota bacterium]